MRTTSILTLLFLTGCGGPAFATQVEDLVERDAAVIPVDASEPDAGPFVDGSPEASPQDASDEMPVDDSGTVTAVYDSGIVVIEAGPDAEADAWTDKYGPCSNAVDIAGPLCRDNGTPYVCPVDAGTPSGCTAVASSGTYCTPLGCTFCCP